MPKKKTTPKDSDNTKTDAPSKAPARLTVSEVLTEQGLNEDVRWVLSRDGLDYFQVSMMFVGLIGLEIALRPSFGKRIQVIGERSVGKTVLTHIFGAAAQSTCRHCWRPIIPWVYEKTGEVKETCLCGAKEPMIVIHVDAEDSFDPPWAARWKLDLKITSDDKSRKTYKNARENFWVVVPKNTNESFNFLEGTIRDGAADFIIIDSVAMTVPTETLSVKGVDVGIGEGRLGSRARFLAEAITRMLVSQINAKCSFAAQPTLMLTNQYYEGPVKHPKSDPRRPVGGKRIGFAVDQEIQLRVVDLHKGLSPKGIKGVVQYIDVEAKVTKAKSGTGPMGGLAHYRLYLDDVQVGGKNSWRTAGDTDEPEKLWSYLKQLGLIDKAKRTYRCLGRDFRTGEEIRAFLARRDIQYLARFPIFKNTLPPSAQDHLAEHLYAYSPFDRDPILDLASETTDAPGECDTAGEGEADSVEATDFVWPK